MKYLVQCDKTKPKTKVFFWKIYNFFEKSLRIVICFMKRLKKYFLKNFQKWISAWVFSYSVLKILANLSLMSLINWSLIKKSVHQVHWLRLVASYVLFPCFAIYVLSLSSYVCLCLYAWCAFVCLSMPCLFIALIEIIFCKEIHMEYWKVICLPWLVVFPSITKCSMSALL